MVEQRRHESPEVGAMVRRMIRALVRRAAEGDIEALEELAKVDQMAGVAVGVASGLMVSMAGYSFGELAPVLGTTRQAVQQRAERAEAPTSTRAWLTIGL